MRYFKLAEFLRSSTAKAKGIENYPDWTEIDHLRELAEALDEFRAWLGVPISVTSGYRSPALNSAIAAASKTSAHQEGWAADLKARGLTSQQLARKLKEWCDETGQGFDQILMEKYNSGATCCHFGLRRPGTGEQRRQYNPNYKLGV